MKLTNLLDMMREDGYSFEDAESGERVDNAFILDCSEIELYVWHKDKVESNVGWLLLLPYEDDNNYICDVTMVLSEVLMDKYGV